MRLKNSTLRKHLKRSPRHAHMAKVHQELADIQSNISEIKEKPSADNSGEISDILKSVNILMEKVQNIEEKEPAILPEPDKVCYTFRVKRNGNGLIEEIYAVDEGPVEDAMTMEEMAEKMFGSDK